MTKTNSNSVSLRELFTAVLNSDFPQELKNRAEAEITKLDTENEKRRAKNAEKAAARKPLIDAIMTILNVETAKTASDVKAALEGEFADSSVQLVSSILTKLQKEGLIISEEVKISGRKCKSYKLVTFQHDDTENVTIEIAE